jgi:hypothetical protein
MTALVAQKCRVTGVNMSCARKKQTFMPAEMPNRLPPAEAFDFFKDYHQDGDPGDCRSEHSSNGNQNEAV